jgi:D-alanyl-D-alanine carboxypeptidase/D-alanyl-D-alanine-endopeptidase (penicillin-binding protein 4)
MHNPFQKMKSPALLFWLPLLLIPPSGFAQSGIQRAIDQLAGTSTMRHATFSACVIDVESGRILASHHPDRSVIPASTLKVVTTATALAILGPSYRFPTDLLYDGDIGRDGQLRGNLYLRGSGDPTLGSGQLKETPGLEEVMEKFRMAVQQKGIRVIEGFIIGDATALPTRVTVPSWQWNDLGNYYAAGAWGLNIHENLYYLHFQQTGTLGATPRIALIEPEVPGLLFHNEVTSAGRGTGDNAYIYGAPYTFLRYVRGTIPVGSKRFAIKGSLPNPPLFAAQHLAMNLERVGILSRRGATTRLAYEQQGGRVGTRRKLLTHYSPPLSVIVGRANQNSVNLYCESLLRSIGIARRQNGDLQASLNALEEEWKQRGLRMDGVHLRDGSGLSARNAVTSRFMAGLLRKAALDDRIFNALWDSLPEMGRSGGQLRAKSGTIARVRGYAGYARPRSGRLLAFAFIANNFTGSGSTMRRQLQQLMQSLIN